VQNFCSKTMFAAAKSAAARVSTYRFLKLKE
jgi:hypothetical protein